MTESFGPGSNGALLVTADLGSQKATGADDGIHDAHNRETRGLERDGTLVPGHRETIKEILEGRRNHRRARLARQNMAR